MKKSELILVTAILFTIGSATITGCGSSEEQHSEETHEHHDGEIEKHEHSAGEEHSHEHAKGEKAHKHGEGEEHGHHGEDHAHKAAHGGIVKTAGNYHIEMVKDEENIRFYLLDGKENTIPNKDITGTAILQLDNQTTVTEKLTAEGDDHFIVQLKEPDKSFTCIVSFKVSGKTVSAKFEKESHSEEGHHH